MNRVLIENAELTQKLGVTETSGLPELLIENEQLAPTLGIGSAPRNLGPIWFLDADGDWATTDLASDTNGFDRGAIYRDADDDVAVDTAKIAGGILLSSQWDPTTHEVVVL